jgi:hypothetical protein
MLSIATAWFPAWRSNARRFEVDHPGDYATSIPTNSVTDPVSINAESDLIIYDNVPELCIVIDISFLSDGRARGRRAATRISASIDDQVNAERKTKVRHSIGAIRAIDSAIRRRLTILVGDDHSSRHYAAL